MADLKDLVIIGSGPAGHTAAIYAARANLKPFMFEGYVAGGSAGGQLTTTTDVENYPGFPDGIQGPELMQLFRKQAERFGTEMVGEDIVEVDFSKRPFVIKSEQREVSAKSVIIATGAVAKRMGVPNEEKMWNNGMSACAVCDGALPFFKNQPLMVIGWFLKKGNAPSHTAQADIPLFHIFSSLGTPILFATAPVAIITDFAFTSLCSDLITNGLFEKSTSTISSPTISVPKRSACLRKSCINSGP